MVCSICINPSLKLPTALSNNLWNSTGIQLFLTCVEEGFIADPNCLLMSWLHPKDMSSTPWDVQQALSTCPAQRKEKQSHVPEWEALDLSSFNRILVKQSFMGPQMQLGFSSGKGKGRNIKAGMAAHNRADCWKSHCSLASPRFLCQWSSGLSHPKPLFSEWWWSNRPWQCLWDKGISPFAAFSPVLEKWTLYNCTDFTAWFKTSLYSQAFL